MNLRRLHPNLRWPAEVAEFLSTRHYLGAAKRGIAWSDDLGVLVLSKPTSRRLPQDNTWLELSRWCLVGGFNAGSMQWGRVRRWLLTSGPDVTTVVSYSDPSRGHTGALYRACGFQWAPTWHRLSPPPSGNGDWGSGPQSVKDRWVYCLRPDARRHGILRGALGHGAVGDPRTPAVEVMKQPSAPRRL